MALSASAPPDIARDIVESLHLNHPHTVVHSLDRPNIYFSCSKSKGLAVSSNINFKPNVNGIVTN